MSRRVVGVVFQMRIRTEKRELHPSKYMPIFKKGENELKIDWGKRDGFQD
jgi:hypothetical protein